MQALIIIPTTKTNYHYGFSAPLAWLFSRHLDKVHGIYGFELTRELVLAYNTFIIELNWYIEFYEFTLLVEFIKKHNPASRILFGGLFAALMHEKIFEKCAVDYFIKGDNEEPLHQFLSGRQPEEIPNFRGRDFDNPLSWCFTAADFRNLRFSLDWFPSYLAYLQQGGQDDAVKFRMPMLITSKGGCTTVHKGCDYCMGAYHEPLKRIYNRPPLIMDNDNLIHLIKMIEQQFDRYCIYMISPFVYDFSGQTFSVPVDIEIDCPVTVAQVENIFTAFRKVNLLLPIYKEGIMGSQIIDYQKFLSLEDQDHRIQFPAYSHDQACLQSVPAARILFNLDNTFAVNWAYWEIYTDFYLASRNSRVIYFHFLEKGYPVFIPGD